MTQPGSTHNSQPFFPSVAPTTSTTATAARTQFLVPLFSSERAILAPMDGACCLDDPAERIIRRWDSETARHHMLFDGDHRAEAERYLRAVDDLRRSSSSSPSLQEVAMARLEDEFRHILLNRATPLQSDSILLSSHLSSLSLASDGLSSRRRRRPSDEDFGGDVDGDEAEVDEEATAEDLTRSDTSSSMGSRYYRSDSSVVEIDLLPSDAVHDLRCIAERMVAAGYERECFQAYASARKRAVEQSLRQVGLERFSADDVQRFEGDALASRIRRWIRAARASVRVIFASERRLCDLVFDGLESKSGSDAPFYETVKGAALQLFGFADAVSVCRNKSPDRLFKVIDLHDALQDLLPDIQDVFLPSDPTSVSSIHHQAAGILSRLAEAVRGILSEFEKAVLLELSTTLVPGGTVHPLTRYVMNYLSLISDYKATLSELIVSKPSVTGRLVTDSAEDASSPPFPEIDFTELDNQTPIALHLVWIMAILESNLESKSKFYRDPALLHLFLMNNVHYIVQKVKGSPELRQLICDNYLRRLTSKFRTAATGYQRAAWRKVLHCLRDEGIHTSGSFSSGISKATLRDRFKTFNAAFEEAHRTQAVWLVPDAELKEELRISISENVFPAYRCFLGRYRQHIESGRHPELYIKYSVEDLETLLEDFFEGRPPTQLSRRRTQTH